MLKLYYKSKKIRSKYCAGRGSKPKRGYLNPPLKQQEEKRNFKMKERAKL